MHVQAAGLLKKMRGRIYDLKEQYHKFFNTQVIALEAHLTNLITWWAHQVDTYHDIESKGIEFLRNIDSAAGLAMR